MSASLVRCYLCTVWTHTPHDGHDYQQLQKDKRLERGNSSVNLAAHLILKKKTKILGHGKDTYFRSTILAPQTVLKRQICGHKIQVLKKRYLGSAILKKRKLCYVKKKKIPFNRLLFSLQTEHYIRSILVEVLVVPWRVWCQFVKALSPLAVLTISP